MANNFPDFKKRRDELLLTQQDISDALGVSVRTVANWDVGEGPSKKTAIEIEKYFQRVVNERKKQQQKESGSKPEPTVIADRGFLVEVQLRNIQWQIAKDRARNAGEPSEWRKYLEEIDADNSEVMKDLLDKTAKLWG